MTSGTARPKWRFALRAFAFFFLGSTVGYLVYALVTHRPGSGVPWIGMLFGSTACAALTAFLPARRHR
ncbi:hypothetical protein F7Q99_30430 [Streptomyces kaniharaensis]|uniref:Uncharacterized protein n=1 Tax=Streptomyces kaniharaensis TaxID=212423 RepID=A0A6N7KXP2_9ACTN|nr:hypothetical protein [Streptomyces kaniharaensis]MQS16402.1 hypothetical protein [Streptomyces kaniharaensis]